MMLSRELTDSEWAEGTPWRRTTVEIHKKRTLITTKCRRFDCLPPSSIPVNLLAKTTTIHSHRPQYTEARLCLKLVRTDALQLMTCISVKVSLLHDPTVDLSILPQIPTSFFPFCHHRWTYCVSISLTNGNQNSQDYDISLCHRFSLQYWLISARINVWLCGLVFFIISIDISINTRCSVSC